jgi:hypothetical protein
MCFRFLQVMWRYLRTGLVPHQGHGVEYEPPRDDGGAAVVEAPR